VAQRAVVEKIEVVSCAPEPVEELRAKVVFEFDVDAERAAAELGEDVGDWKVDRDGVDGNSLL